MTRPLFLSCLLSVLNCVVSGAALGAPDCRGHVAVAEAAHGVPTGLLTAIGYVESGMDPYAINADGASYHPRTADEAVSLVRQLQRGGARFIDVGCMQIDLFYHPNAFSNLYEAFEPSANATYGASLLASQRNEFGDWASAVGYYHSSDPAKQAEYLRRVSALYSGNSTSVLGAGRTSSATPPKVSVARPPRMITVRLSFMTVTRPVDDSFRGGR